MKYGLLSFTVLLLLGTASAQEEVVAVDPDTEVAEGVATEAEGEDLHHYWGVSEQTDEDYNGTEAIILEFNDEWEAGDPWDPNEESDREGSGLGGNPDGNEFLPPVLGDEVVTGPVMEVFQGRDVTESLATEHGRGGGARGHARGRGRPDTRRNRNLRATKFD